MNRILDYKLVAESGIGKLNTKAADLLQKGYQPFGNVSVAVGVDGEYIHSEFVQAFVLYGKEGE